MQRRFFILMTALLLLTLSACGSGERGSEKILAYHEALERFAWSGTLRVDYGDRVIDFGLECETTAEQTKLRVTSPEMLRGLTAALPTDGQSAKLEYDGFVLDTGKLPGTGRSPLELVPLIQQQWAAGYVITETRERLNGEMMDRLTYSLGNLEVTAWFTAEHTPIVCELAADGTQVARLTIDTFGT